jgi:fermentation-respiration switch protein FrsA (DUF1100 family)
MPPAEAAARISPTPVLIVHGDQDIYFPPDHARQLYDAAREPKELWLIPGFGHAERHTDDALVDRAREPKELWLIPGFGHAERHTDDALVDRLAAWADQAAAVSLADGTHQEEPTAS